MIQQVDEDLGFKLLIRRLNLESTRFIDLTTWDLVLLLGQVPYFL
jgi:hypothetical protein